MLLATVLERHKLLGDTPVQLECLVVQCAVYSASNTVRSITSQCEVHTILGIALYTALMVISLAQAAEPPPLLPASHLPGTQFTHLLHTC